MSLETLLCEYALTAMERDALIAKGVMRVSPSKPVRWPDQAKHYAAKRASGICARCNDPSQIARIARMPEAARRADEGASDAAGGGRVLLALREAAAAGRPEVLPRLSQRTTVRTAGRDARPRRSAGRMPRSAGNGGSTTG